MNTTDEKDTSPGWKGVFLTGVLLTSLLSPLTAYSSMRCDGGNVVVQGTQRSQVLEWCGEPTSISQTPWGVDSMIYKQSDVSYLLTIGNDDSVNNITTVANF